MYSCPGMSVNYNEKVPGEVTYIESVYRLWFRPASWEIFLNNVTEALEAGDEFLPAQELKLGKIYCAKFSEDNAYYRCRIISIHDKEVTVEFIDYMNCERKLASEILNLPPQLQKVPPIVLDLDTNLGYLSDTEKNRHDLEEFLTARSLSLDICGIKIQDFYQDGQLVNKEEAFKKFDKKEVISSPANGNGTSSSSKKETLSNSNSPPKEVKDTSPKKYELSLPLFKKIDGSVEYIEDIKSIWFVQDFLQDGLNELMEKLAEVGPALKSVQNLSFEEIYATIYSEDSEYYRCKALSEDNGKILVRFIDYGNTETKSLKEILDLPQSLKKYSPSAAKVFLLDTASVSNQKENQAILEDALLGQKIQISLEVVNGDKLAKVYIDNKRMDLKFVDMNMNEEEGVFQDLTLPVDEIVKGSVVYVEDTSAVWFTPAAVQGSLDDLMKRLEVASSSLNKVPNPQEDRVYGARFSADQVIYRCVLKRKDEKITAHFIDFGNSEDKSEDDFMELPHELKSIPAAATKLNLKDCELDEYKIEDLLASDDVEVVTGKDGFATFYRERVQLLPKKVDKMKVHKMRKLPIGMKVPGVVVHSQHGKAWFMPSDAECDLEEIINGLDQHSLSLIKENNPEENGIYCTVFSEDQALYRCRVIKKGNVFTAHFIDYGNEELKTKEDFFKLPEELCGYSPIVLPIKVPKDEKIPIDCEVEVIMDQDGFGKFQIIMNNNYPEGKSDEVAVMKTIQSNDKKKSPHAMKTARRPVEDEVPLPTGFKIPVAVGFVESIDKIWVTFKEFPGYKDEEKIIETVQNTLEDESKLVPIGTPSKDTYCVARFGDGMLYRGKVTDSNPAAQTATVFFIDYGNSDDCNEFYQLSADLAEYPPAAHCIRIFKASEVDDSKENREKFDNLLDLEVEVLLEKSANGELLGNLFIDNVMLDSKGFSCQESNNNDHISTKLITEQKVNYEEQNEGKEHLKEIEVVTNSVGNMSFSPTTKSKAGELKTRTASNVVKPDLNSRPSEISISDEESAKGSLEKDFQARGKKPYLQDNFIKQNKVEVIANPIRQEIKISRPLEIEKPVPTVPTVAPQQLDETLRSTVEVEVSVGEKQAVSSPETNCGTKIKSSVKSTMNIDVPQFIPSNPSTISAVVSQGTSGPTQTQSSRPTFDFGQSNQQRGQRMLYGSSSLRSSVGVSTHIVETAHGTCEYASLSELSKTLAGSSMLQTKLLEGNAEVMKMVYKMVMAKPVDYANNPMATYLVQKLIACLQKEELVAFAKAVGSHFLEISTNKNGTHVVQELLKQDDPDVSLILIRSLAHVKNLPQFLSTVNGSHVAQACLCPVMEKEVVTFIVAGILPDLIELSNGVNSTFFIQKLINFMRAQGFTDVNLLVKGVLNNITHLAFNNNGTRIVQLAISKTSDKLLKRGVQWMTENFRLIYKNREAVFASLVIIEQMIARQSSEEWCTMLLQFVQTIIRETDEQIPLFICAAKDLNGYKICNILLKTIKGRVREDFIALISQYFSVLENCVAGINVIKVSKNAATPISSP